MVYLRSKKVKGDEYLYLVQSVWDSKNATSRQEIVKYLGKSSLVTLEDIPVQYKNSEKISSFLESNKNKFKDSQKLIRTFQKNLLESLQQGDLEKSLDVYVEFRKFFGVVEFYEKILRPVMYKIGELWAQKKINIATEHICSNVAHNLIDRIKLKNHVSSKKHTVLICTPMGEEHCIGCNILSSYLSSKGFHVLNLSPSVPASSILLAIDEKRPDAVLISITTEDNLATGQRLIKKIKEQHDIPIIVGGQAVMNNYKKFDAVIHTTTSLNSILKILLSN